MLITNLTRSNSDNEALRQFRIKLELEARFRPQIKKLLDSMTREFDRMYRAVGLILPARAFQNEWKELLQRIYIQTARIFSGDIRTGGSGKKFFEIKQTEIDTTEEEAENMEAEIAAGMAIWIDQTSTEQARLITKTNADEINLSVSMAKKGLNKRNEFIEPQKVADIATPRLFAVAVARSALIAAQEVGTAQSQSRFTEAVMVNSSNATLAGETLRGKIVKGWNGILDAKIRPAHAQADFTYALSPIPTVESFIVGGEPLKYPRDPAGSAGNIINCRCEAVYSTN